MANNLAKCRAMHGLTQEQLGNKLGLTRAAINFMEKHKLSAKNAVKCAEALNVSPFYLLGIDVFKLVPKTETDKEILISIIKDL